MDKQTTGLRVVKLRHPGRIVAAVVVILLAVLALWSVAQNPRFDWPTVWRYFFNERVLAGLLMTIELTVGSMLIAIIVGLVLALMRQSVNPVLSSVSWLYIWFFRGTPALVQFIFWYNFAALYPTLTLGIPFIGPTFAEIGVNTLITPIVAGFLGLGLNQAAYMAEIIRGSLLGVGRGQREAAEVLGLSAPTTLFKVILPQAMRTMVPPTANQFIMLLKETSLVSVISVSELLFVVESIAATTFKTIPLLVTASIWYLIVVSILTVVQYQLERRFSRGADRNDDPQPFAKWFAANLLRFKPRRSAAREEVVTER